ncbi:MAG TPA: hypothetical protein VLA66_09475, partial [Thermoanaerobaculia bacterium]|nr:hypothetical protein [Thermoanaerobaculia bacterium]
FARAGAPLLWRQKAFTEGLSDEDRARLLGAELRLTRTFLAERLAGETLETALLSAPSEVEGFWKTVLEDGLARPVAALQSDYLPLAGSPAAAPPVVIAPLVGAVCREIAACAGSPPIWPTRRSRTCARCAGSRSRSRPSPCC